MVDLARRSALAGLVIPGAYGASGPQRAGVRLTERRDLVIVEAYGAPYKGLLSETVRDHSSDAGSTVLWIGPGHALVVCADDRSRATPSELDASLKGLAESVTDVSHGYTVLRLAGVMARAVLAKGCPLDLDRREFAPGECARSLLGDVATVIHGLPRGDGFDLYTRRSFAVAMWEWLTDAAAEYGYVVGFSVSARRISTHGKLL